MHEIIKDLVSYEDDFTAEDWKFLADYGREAENMASKEHEKEKMRDNL